MIDKYINIEYVDVEEALRYLGYGNSKPNNNMQELLSLCERELLASARPKYLYEVFDLNDYGELIDCDFPLIGNDIKKHLTDCEKVAFVCVTLSAEVDKIIRVNQIGNVTKAVIIDAMANALIEQVCDSVEDILREEYKHYNFTWRFGVGYGDFSLSAQKKFLEVLQAPKKIGVCVNDSYILTPSKSVTCIIGMSGLDIANTEKTCDNCSFTDRCQYRKRGNTCGNKRND